MLLKHSGTQNFTHQDNQLRDNPKHSDTWK